MKISVSQGSVLGNSGQVWPERKQTMTRHYAGKHSKQFWDAVNKLPRNEGGETAYMLGVMLQEVEERVLSYIENRKTATSSSQKVTQ